MHFFLLLKFFSITFTKVIGKKLLSNKNEGLKKNKVILASKDLKFVSDSSVVAANIN